VVVDETGGAERNNPVVDGSARVAGAKRNPGPSKASGNSNSRKESSRVLQDTDVLVSVAVHNPAKPAMVLEEFLCLGSNTLGELKDRISCAADAQAAEAGLPAFEKRGAFFIEGVFHEDRRDRVDDAAGGGDGTTDSNSSYQYSTPIIEVRPWTFPKSRLPDCPYSSCEGTVITCADYHDCLRIHITKD